MKLTPIDAPAKWESLKPHPICLAWPTMTDEELADLSTSLESDGYHPGHPIILFEGMILDGRHRHMLARQNKVIPEFVRAEGTMAQACAFAIAANSVRRSLTKQQRVLIAMGLNDLLGNFSNHDDSKSSRTNHNEMRDLAAVVGASYVTVQRAKEIRAALPPDEVRHIIAGRKTVKEAMADHAPPKAPKRPDPVVEKDSLGRPIHRKARAALTRGIEDCRSVWNQAAALKRELTKLLTSPWGDRMHERQMLADFDNAFRAVRLSAPYTSCPMDSDCGQDCKLCRGSQWITKSQWDSLPPEYRRID